jgi:hypothetical protein
MRFHYSVSVADLRESGDRAFFSKTGELLVMVNDFRKAFARGDEFVVSTQATRPAAKRSPEPQHLHQERDDSERGGTPTHGSASGNPENQHGDDHEHERDEGDDHAER